MTERRTVKSNFKWILTISLSVFVPLLIAFLMALGAGNERIKTLESDHEKHEVKVDQYIERPEFEQFEKRMTEQHDTINEGIKGLRDDLRVRRRSRPSSSSSNGNGDNQ